MTIINVLNVHVATFSLVEKNKDDLPGRTAEVASIIKMVEKITKGRCKLPPFMTHTLNEVLEINSCSSCHHIQTLNPNNFIVHFVTYIHIVNS